MNAALRRRQRQLTLGLVLVLPIGLGAALAQRLPVQLGGGQAATADPLPDWPALIGVGEGADATLVHRVRPAASGAGLELQLQAAEDFAYPDLLLYWGPGAPGTGALVGDEYLLGSFFGSHLQTLSLPSAVVEDLPGRLVFYSLARAEVILEAGIAPTAVER